MRCPTCKSELPEVAEADPLPPFFPFCCERCKLIDLGRWLDGKYQVEVVDREDGSAPPPSGDPYVTD